MPDWQPLFFEPIYRKYLWGGRRLESYLQKPLGDGPNYAESWEVVDHGPDQSVIADGPHAGRTLHQLVVEFGDQVLGPRRSSHRLGVTEPSSTNGRFPLLFKFLDAHRVLSLQVHPNDEQAAQLDPPDLGKTEAWVILAAEPEAVLYAGLQSGATKDDLREALAAGAADRCMHVFSPAVGDCVLIEAGVPHAIGAGLLVAEIQQASDTTFRLHDWHRTDAEGKPRELHLEQGLAVIDERRGPAIPQVPQPTDEPGRTRLVQCDKFVIDRIHGTNSYTFGDQQFHILSVLSGAVELRWAGGTRTMRLGQTTLLPAAIQVEVQAVDCNAPMTLLDMRLP